MENMGNLQGRVKHPVDKVVKVKSGQGREIGVETSCEAGLDQVQCEFVL